MYVTLRIDRRKSIKSIIVLEVSNCPITRIECCVFEFVYDDDVVTGGIVIRFFISFNYPTDHKIHLKLLNLTN